MCLTTLYGPFQTLSLSPPKHAIPTYTHIVPFQGHPGSDDINISNWSTSIQWNSMRLLKNYVNLYLLTWKIKCSGVKKQITMMGTISISINKISLTWAGRIKQVTFFGWGLKLIFTSELTMKWSKFKLKFSKLFLENILFFPFQTIGKVFEASAQGETKQSSNLPGCLRALAMRRAKEEARKYGQDHQGAVETYRQVQVPHLQRGRFCTQGVPASTLGWVVVSGLHRNR